MRKKKFPYLILLFLFYVCNLAGQPTNSFSEGNNHTERVESPSSDLAYEFYIEKLNQQTPLDLIYNKEVKFYIDQFLGGRRNELVQSLSRSGKYFPVIEEILDRYDLPLELKYMAVIESGLNPLAKSKSGAIGLWQFLYNTCSLVDLEVNSYIDERRDPYKSTEAACRYLEYLYDTFHDWNLVLAGYNGGPGEVRKAIERSGGKTDFWEIRPYLSVQTRNYVPAFIAMNYLMNNYEDHGIYFDKSVYNNRNIDTLHIDYAISFNQISLVLDISESTLIELNPIYKRKYIPDLDQPCILILPKETIADYLRYENMIIGFILPKSNYNTLLANAGNTCNREKILHVVSHGEFFHKIAINYHCTFENIKAWNKLDNLTLIPGQILEIWIENNKEK
ncbi:hypothetical protein ES703_24592 [subsurface metagenome]